MKSNGSGAPTWATFDFASSGHSHTLKIETTSNNSSIDLAANTKYKLTAGGSTYVFKTPAAGSASGAYLPLAGGTMTGEVIFGTSSQGDFTAIRPAKHGCHYIGTNSYYFYRSYITAMYCEDLHASSTVYAEDDVQSDGGFVHTGISSNRDNYVLLAGGGYKALSEFGGGGGGSVSVGSVTSGTYQVVGVDTSNTSALKYLATSGGHFYFTTSGAYHTSDERMKHDIWDILQDDVDELFGTNNGYIRHFAWNSNDVEAYGFIAQELEEFCPEAIHINEDGYYGVNYNVAFSKILGAMFKKIKQQDKEIKKLKKIIEKHK